MLVIKKLKYYNYVIVQLVKKIKIKNQIIKHQKCQDNSRFQNKKMQKWPHQKVHLKLM